LKYDRTFLSAVINILKNSMNSKKKRKMRDALRLVGALMFSWLYIPHFVTMQSWGVSD
jgi:hypothetical protein